MSKFAIVDSSVYSKDANGNLFYPKDSNNNQFYNQIGNKDVLFETTNGPQYARDANNNEIYPKDDEGNDTYVQSKYAVKSSGIAFFPKNKHGDEFYQTHADGSSIVVNSTGYPIHKYAKDRHGNEIYPQTYIKTSDSFSEMFINDQYAKQANNEVIYPIDEFGNEHFAIIEINSVVDESLSFPNSYPITNDGYVIAPNVKNRPYFLNTSDPKVDASNVVGRLFNEVKGYFNFLTNVKSKRKSRASEKEYLYKPTGSSKETTWVPESLKNKPKGNKKKGKNIRNLLCVVVFLLLVIIALYAFQIFKR